MKEPIAFLQTFKTELEQWLDNPTVSAPPEVMNKIHAAVELAIELLHTNRKASPDEMNMFEGGPYLSRYFDGWGGAYHEKYIALVEYVKKHHWL